MCTNKLHRDPTLEKSNPYEFKMAFFDNSKPDELLLFISNFQRTLKASGTLTSSAKIQYLRTMVYDKSLSHLYMLSADLEITTSEHSKFIILGLGTYFFPINSLSRQKRVMFHVMRKLRGLKVRCCAYRMIDLNEYLDVFPGAKASEKCVRRS